MSLREAEYGGGRGFDENTRNQSILDGVSRLYSGAKEQMKTWEALKAADEGKKIRRKCWMKGGVQHQGGEFMGWRYGSYDSLQVG